VVSRPPRWTESGQQDELNPARPADGMVVTAAFAMVAANIVGFIVGVPAWALWFLAFGLGVLTAAAWRVLGRGR
jgi:hypothetical protein